jgi:hypothetical protein
VSGRLARWVLRLYPLAFRRRYGEEMRALLDQQQPTASAVLDLLRGALVAHVRPPAAAIDWVDAADRLRASASGVLICWVLFAAAGFGFYKTTEDRAFSAAGHAHPVLAVAHVAVQSLALIASAAVVLGALPLIAVALTRARHDPKLRQIVARAPLPLAVFGALTAVVVAIAHAHPGHHGSGGYGLAVAWGIAGLGCGIACALLSRAALFAVPASAIRLRLALAGAPAHHRDVEVALLRADEPEHRYRISLPSLAKKAAALFRISRSCSRTRTRRRRLRELLLLIRGQALTTTLIDLDLLAPITQRLMRDPERLRDIDDRAALTYQLDRLTTELHGIRRTRPWHGHHTLPAGSDKPKRSSVHDPGAFHALQKRLRTRAGVATGLPRMG